MSGLTALAIIIAPSVSADDPMDDLLRQIQESSRASAKLNKEREQRFLRNKGEQARLLAKAQKDLAAAKARVGRIRAKFEAGQKEIATLKQQLQTQLGDTGQMQAAARQLAGDFRAQAADSIITAQFPDRLNFLTQFSRSQEIPPLEDLEHFWFLLAQEMAQTGKSAKFEADIVDAKGGAVSTQVVRIGPFTAMADGLYLVPQADSARLAALPRQPARKADLARDFAALEDGVGPVLIDPSRGGLLRIEGDKPNLLERVQQGGLVGYLIILIGAVGLLIAFVQFVYLARVRSRVRRQLSRLDEPSQDNPLGRLLSSLEEEADTTDPELLELHLSERVLRETPRLERFQSLIRLFAAVAPLMGLLGTVTGMIVTFQAITAFGTGDPRLMADGISQALVTTVLGLTAAIPLLFANSWLVARSRKLIQTLDEQSARLLAARMDGSGV
ncbi:MAG: MotA/TolQ/ExbB proton channel family protein [Panacagrimonas sp.]